MVRMVKVLEAIGPGAGYLAEVPGQQGRYVVADNLPELKTKLQQALTDPEGSRFAVSSWPELKTGYSDTALFVAL